MMKRKLLSLLVTLALILILFSQISLERFLVVISSMSLFWVAIGFIMYSLSYLFRTIRVRVLLGDRISLKEIYPIVCLHSMANNIMPARLGELSYIYLVKKLHRIPTAEGIASLTIARVFDLIALSSLLFLSAVFVGNIPAVIANSFMVMGGLMLVPVVFIIFVVHGGRRFVSLMEKIFIALNLKRFEKVELILEKSLEIIDCFHVVKSRRVIFYTLLNSFAVWFFIYLMNLSLLRGMGLNLALPIIILGSTFSVLTNIAPVPSIASIGIYEGVWALAFISLGIPKEAAILSGFVAHIMMLVYVALLSGMAMYGLRDKNINPFRRE